MRSLVAHASLLAWAFAALAITGNAIEAWVDPQWSAWPTARFVVSTLFTVFFVIAVVEWVVARRGRKLDARG